MSASSEIFGEPVTTVTVFASASTVTIGSIFSEAQARAVWSIRSRIYVVSRFLPDSSAISCRSFFAFW